VGNRVAVPVRTIIVIALVVAFGVLNPAAVAILAVTARIAYLIGWGGPGDFPRTRGLRRTG
jgi:hypothetical protein